MTPIPPSLRLDTRYAERGPIETEGLDRALDALLARQSAGTAGFLTLDEEAWGLPEAERLGRSLADRADVLVLIGIGGSALGGRALEQALRPAPSGPAARRLAVLDTIDPAYVGPILADLDPNRTAVVVISKSGGTIETAALFRLVSPWIQRAEDWRDRMVFITDPVRGLLRPVAEAWGLEVLAVPPDVGGRFSVLTSVGILPAAFLGLDVQALLAGARRMAGACVTRSLDTNPAWRFAAVHDAWWPDADVTVFYPYSERLRGMGEWFQQLWAESLGKPRVDADPYGWTPAAHRGPTDQHSQLQMWQEGPVNRIVTFVGVDDPGCDLGPLPLPEPGNSVVPSLAPVTLRRLLDAERLGTGAALISAGRPVIDLRLPRVDEASIGELIVFLEAATAFAGLLRDIDPFDQPGVELGKRVTQALLEEGLPARSEEIGFDWALEVIRRRLPEAGG
jgi:glucose-6-phosphate isomerase